MESWPKWVADRSLPLFLISVAVVMVLTLAGT